MRCTVKFLQNVFFAVSACLILFSGVSASAITLNEWGFGSDPAGQTLSQALNVGSIGVVFAAGGSGFLETDGLDGLLCTHEDIGTGGMWTSGAILDAPLPAPVSSGVQYLRYDFSYDLSDTNSLNDSGMLVGFAFYDSIGNKVAGAALKRDLGAGGSAPCQETTLTEVPPAGTIAIIAKVNLAAQTMDVWYDLTGDVSGFVEGTPATNIAVSLSAFDALRFQSTGDIQPAGSSDEVTVDLLRTADSWASIMEDEPDTLGRKYANEWTFECDADGTSLTQALNSGTNSPLAQFDAGFGSTIFTTNRVLLCTGEGSGGGVWADGAILNAPLTSLTTGKHYLRYDVDYDFSSPDNGGGNVLGVYFTDSTGDKAAGLILGYDTGDLEDSAPANRALMTLTNDIALVGTLTAIAEVDLDNDILKVWYDLNGANVFDENSPAASKAIMFSSHFDNLTFHATGDFRPAGSTDYGAVDNIRQATSWSEIINPPVNETGSPELRITVTAPAGMAVGDSNVVTISINNIGGPASNVTSTLIHDGAPSAFTIVSNNIAAPLGAGASLTNTYWITANTEESYTFTAQAFSAETNSAAASFILAVGSQISYLSNRIVEVSGGLIDGKYEPGETLDITVFSINDGGGTVSNIINSLTSSGEFSVSNLTPVAYPSMAVGATTSTTYRVMIQPETPHGRYWLRVTNWTASRIWTNAFAIDVYRQGLPSVAPSSITINVLADGTATNREVVVTNSGNVALTFSITDDGAWGVEYAVSTETKGIRGFVAANTEIELTDPVTNSSNIEAANAGVSTSENIGFGFPFYGTVYSNFYVTADGYIGLSNTTNVPWMSADQTPLPTKDGAPLIAPFWGTLNSPAGSIRTIRQYDYLVISYTGVSKESGGDNLQFQVALYTNGRIDFRYKNIVGITSTYGLTNVTIGIQGDAGSCINLTTVPVNGTSIRLVPQQNPWVAYTPDQNVTVGPQSSQGVSFIADGFGKAIGVSESFVAQFNWSTGGSSPVSVSANVTAPAPAYNAVSSLSFTGAAGQVTSAPFVITNSGTGPLTFSINNSALSAAGYTDNTNLAYNWIDISATGTNVFLLDPSPSPYITADDEGFSAMIPIGFTFPFYGSSYTQLCVSVNGAVRLDTTGRVYALGNLASTVSFMPAQLIAPYWGELTMDANATIKYRSFAEQMVITWGNIRQYGVGGGSNLTFQVVMNPSGDITFQYKHLEGSHWPDTVIGLRDTASRTRQMDIRLQGDWSVSTSSVSGSVYTQYVSAVSNRAAGLLPAQIQVIGYTPPTGSIAAGGVAQITMTGDASNQSSGSGTISTSAVLTITHNASGSPDSLAVTFTVTNSQEAVFVAADKLDSDGDGLTDDQERIAGTDLQDAGSVFTPTVEHSPAGPVLSWEEPLDGLQRIYKVYWTINLMSSWEYLDTVTNGTIYLDEANINEPVIYYRVTVE